MFRGWDRDGLPIEYKVVKESRKLSPFEVCKKSGAFARLRQSHARAMPG
jgi:isoleucyl-tRNA synthetase